MTHSLVTQEEIDSLLRRAGLPLTDGATRTPPLIPAMPNFHCPTEIALCHVGRPSPAPPPPTDERLAKFIARAGFQVLVCPLDSADDKRFVWLLNVPEEDLCRAHDEAVRLSIRLYYPKPVPFLIGAADSAQSDRLLMAHYDTLRPGTEVEA